MRKMLLLFLLSPLSALAQMGGNTYLPNNCILNGSPQSIQCPTQLPGTASIPVILAPNGTVATNGIVTLGTALPFTYPFAWIRFPAAAISGGAAGVYYATCTSTTSCQVYTNFFDPSAGGFIPFIPGTLVNATGSNSAYTQTTGSAIILVSANLPGGSLGANGAVRETATFLMPNNANNKIAGLGLQGGTIATSTVTTNLSTRQQWEGHNIGDQAHQYAAPLNFGATAASGTMGTLDMTTLQHVIAQCNMATATDYCIVAQSTFEFFPAP